MMEKIIFIGKQGTGKTTLARAIVSQGKGAIIDPLMSLEERKKRLYLCERVAFDGFFSTQEVEYFIYVLSVDSICMLTHIVFCYQEHPEWLTESFIKQNYIKVFKL